MAISKNPPSITQRLLDATKLQADTFARRNSDGGNVITYPEMRGMLTAFDADPATIRALDGGPTHYSQEAKDGLVRILGDRKMDRGARVEFLKAIDAWPEHTPGDEIVALYAVAIRRAADEVRADPTNPEKIAVARMMSTMASEILQPVAATATVDLAGTGVTAPAAPRGRMLSMSVATSAAHTAFAASSETTDGLNKSLEALKDLNAAIQGQ